MSRYLAALAVMLACFLGDVSAVTDQDFQDLSNLVRSQASEITDLKEQLRAALGLLGTVLGKSDMIQNTTIEERVTLLELQMTEVYDDVALLFENDNFLFDEQVIQDERLLNLEEATGQTAEELDQIKDDIEGLQDTTLALEFQLTVLEGNVNSSVSELEVRVETLEGTSVDHEARITSSEGDIEDLEGSIADHETRLTAAEENIQGLQATDVNHDARITALETQNDTIAFHAVLTSYDTIADGANAVFNEVLLNEGNGYDDTTGVFTVPPGGDGLYYVSTYLLIDDGNEEAAFDIHVNDDAMCRAHGEHKAEAPGDTSQAACSAVVSVVEGDEVKLVLKGSTNDTPLYVGGAAYWSGFSGFRI